MILPITLLDDEGYPTDEWLGFLRNYKPSETLPIEEFVTDVLRQGWWMPEWGFKLHKKYRGRKKLELHTGGWSGNEEVIEAIKSNIWLAGFSMRYEKWNMGGHFYFSIKVT